MLGHSALVFLVLGWSRLILGMFPSAFSIYFFISALLWFNLGPWLISKPWTLMRHRNHLNGHFVGGIGTAEKNNKSQRSGDYGIWMDLGIHSFPLHLVEEKMCHLDAFGLKLTATCCLPVGSPWSSSPFGSAVSGCSRRTHNGNQL